MRYSRYAAGAAALALLAGCAGQVEGSRDPTVTVTEAPDTVTPKGSGYGDKYTAPAPQDDYTTPYGGTWKWDTGLAVKVGKPKEYRPQEDYDASVTKFKRRVLVTITISNGMGQPWDPGGIMVTASSDGKEADWVMDDVADQSPPSTTVRPGKSLTFTQGFAVADPADVEVEVQPDFDHEPALFVAQ